MGSSTLPIQSANASRSPVLAAAKAESIADTVLGGGIGGIRRPEWEDAMQTWRPPAKFPCTVYGPRFPFLEPKREPDDALRGMRTLRRALLSNDHGLTHSGDGHLACWELEAVKWRREFDL